MMKHWKEYGGHCYSLTGQRNKVDTTIYTFDIETSSYLVLDFVCKDTEKNSISPAKNIKYA